MSALDTRTGSPSPSAHAEGGPHARDRALDFQPGLEGLRGLSVLAVVLFHAEFSWAKGGYLGVSTFFTLSGFLICSLLVAEHRREGRVGLKEFWARRFRRLMPASLLTLAVVLVYGAVAADSTQLENLRSDVLTALAYCANWGLIVSDQSYGELFSSPSPVLHFWSLAIEEQFYVFFPLLTVGVLRWGRGSTRHLFAVFGSLAVGLSALMTWMSRGDAFDIDRVYFGTDTRAPELLVGALLAVWYADHRHELEAARRRWSTIGTVALGVTVIAWVTVAQSSAWLYRGGLFGYAVLSVLIILGAVMPASPVRSALSNTPLRYVGRISYGVYLFHWPVFVWLTPERTDLDRWSLLALRLVVTLAVASLSFELVEWPIRKRRMLSGPATVIAAPVMIALLAFAAVLVTEGAPTTTDFEAIDRELNSGTVPAFVNTSEPTVAFFGDSTALMSGLGYSTWARKTPLIEPGPKGSSELGCGILGAGKIRYRGDELKKQASCDLWKEQWIEALDSGPPDVAVVQLGAWEVNDRVLPGDDEFSHIGEKAFDDLLLTRMVEAVDILSERRVAVVWILSPHILAGTVDGNPPNEEFSENDPARIDRFNELVRQLPELRPGRVALVELPTWLQSTPEGEMDTRLRPDLVHWAETTTEEVSERFLGQAVVDAYRSLVPENVTTTT